MDNLINKLVEIKGAIKQAIIDKKREIDGGELDPGEDISKYSEKIIEYLTPEFEFYFTSIGYNGIPKQLLDTLQGQLKYNENFNSFNLKNSLFIGSNFKGDFDENRKCIILFTNSLSGSVVFNYLYNLLEIYVLKDIYLKDFKNIDNLKESVINPYWFFRGTSKIKHIYGILDVNDIGYTVNLDPYAASKPGDYFFSGFLGNGNSTTVAQVSYLETLYMKNIHRAYNFGKSPLSMDSVLYCIRNAKRDENYAINEKTEEAEGTYKFTLMGSAYAPEQIDEIQQELATKIAEGVNMEILFSGN